eukprot:2271232-Pleurochrysis_carterae.AAC.1
MLHVVDERSLINDAVRWPQCDGTSAKPNPRRALSSNKMISSARSTHPRGLDGRRFRRGRGAATFSCSSITY